MPTDSASNLAFRARGDYLRSCVLLLLTEGAKHGYELLAEMPERGYGDVDAGGLYRTLRGMEDEGLVSSHWDVGDAGPARRIYAVTDHGMAELADSAVAVRHMRRRLNRFLQTYRHLTDDVAGQTS